MRAISAKFERKDLGSANVQIPSGTGMPDPLDVAVDPYAPTKRTHGVKIKAFQAWPQKGGPFPAVILLHERWGLTQHFQELAFRIAGSGYVALAVDQYSRIGGAVTADPAHAGQLKEKVNRALLMQDLTAAVEYLNFQEYVKKHRIAVMGFDMGGSHALSFASTRRQLRACVVFYGEIPLDSLGSLRCPVQYHQPEQDNTVTSRDVEQLAQKLATQNAICEVYKYTGALHGFFNDTRPEVFNAEAAGTAWSRTLSFLDQYILAEHAGVRPLPDSERRL